MLRLQIFGLNRPGDFQSVVIGTPPINRRTYPHRQGDVGALADEYTRLDSLKGLRKDSKGRALTRDGASHSLPSYCQV